MFEIKPIMRSLGAAFGGLATALVVAVPVAAQQQQQESQLEEVVVTGTRIRTPGAVSNSPISSVGAEEIKAGQPVVVEQFFKELPAAVPAIGSGTNNGTGGGATLDLRGLGANRSLVLVDGRRLTPFDLTGAVDTNSIPIALLQRVDLITGGASAVYGADAIAGVANFILRRDFRGIEASVSQGQSSKSDAKRSRVDVTMGAGLDNGKGNVALSFGYTRQDPLRQDARPIGQFSQSSTTGARQGSGTAVPVVEFSLGQLDLTTGQFGALTNTFNFNPDNYYQTPLDRYQFTTLGNYTINDHADLYAQLFFTRSDVGSQLAPSGTFFNDYFLPLGNPFLPAAARAQLCAAQTPALTPAQCADPNTEVLVSLGRRFVELGPRLNDFQNTLFQATFGSRGALVGSWSYDVYGSFGKSDQTQTRGNWGSSSKVQQALRALTTTDCLDTSNGCVPLNLFGPAGSITPAMTSFINLDAVLLQQVEQKVVSASIAGDLGSAKSPWSSSPIGVAVGFEYRRVEAGNKSDGPSQILGEVLGTGAPTPDRSGKFDLRETFAELSIPILTDKPFAKRLALETGYRNTTFSAGGRSDSYGTWKYGGEWEPVTGFRVRGMQQRATRAPNVDELFQPLVTGLSNLAVDPCQGTSINAADANTPGTLSNLCRLTGVPLANIGTLGAPSAGQINNQTGGNPNLGPEVADTTTIGFVFQPAFARGLTITADYWKIDIDDAVSSPSVTDVLEDCYNPARNPGFAFVGACAQVLRNPNNGSFNGAAAPGVVTPLSNLGKIATSGYDLGITYGVALRDLGINPRWGRVDVSFTASFLDEYLYQATPRSINRNCLGYYSIACGAVSAGEGPIYETKWSQRTTWTVGDFALGYNWRRVSSVSEEPGGSNFLPAFSTIKEYDWVDLSAVWNVNKNLRLNLSINNAFDKDPPNVGNTIGTTTANSGNTFPQSYDVIGRYYTLGLIARF